MGVDKNKIILIGGFCEVIEALIENDYEIEGIVEPDNCSLYKYYGNDQHYLLNGNKEMPLLIAPDKPDTRMRLYNLYTKAGFIISTFIHSQAYLSPTCLIENGCFIQRMAHISAGVIVKKGSRINAMVNIMHHSQIGEFTTIAPNAVILGYVKIGNNCYIGANSTILPNLVIEDNAIIGAGSVVTKNIKKDSIVKGVPAK
jgi:sugar O-acyltransferase (sialic acid O-acetyltransferase NeuD family)